MIYLLDEPKTNTSHSNFMECILSKHTSENIILIEISSRSTIGDIYRSLEYLKGVVRYSDIIFCPWCIPGNVVIDSIFEELAERCWVVAAAGNNNELIDNYTPARVRTVITVGALNKSGVKASLSNYSNAKKIEWVVGTNYSVGWEISSGTSISSALYTAFLAESIRCSNPTIINRKIEEIRISAASELS